MACEHGQNLAVEPLDTAANSALRITQRTLDLIKVTRDIVALDRPPPISNLDNPRLQVIQHGRNRRQLGRITGGIGRL